MNAFILLLDRIIYLYIWVLIINAVLSWLVAFNVLNKIRKFIPNLGSIDISPVVLILLLFFIRNLFFELLAPNLF